jgi:hypothetical protein
MKKTEEAETQRDGLPEEIKDLNKTTDLFLTLARVERYQI